MQTHRQHANQPILLSPSEIVQIRTGALVQVTLTLIARNHHTQDALCRAIAPPCSPPDALPFDARFSPDTDRQARLFLTRGGVAAGRRSSGSGEPSDRSRIDLGTDRFLMVFSIKEQKSRGLFV